jgi:lipopolysaccharide biosynthesis regulator YciM
MCAGYVKTVNQLVQQQGAKAADACKGMAKSSPQ